MTICLSSNIVKARFNHQCNYCFEPIPKGERYLRSGLVYDNTAYAWKSHLRCDRIAHRLRMFDEVDEGLTGDDFCETIRYEFDNLHKDEEDYDIPKFNEQLDFVCKKYDL